MKRSLFTRIFRDKSGVAALEMALFLPLFLLLITGTIDVAMAFAKAIQVEQAAQRAAEMVFNTKDVNSNFAFVRTDAAAAANVNISDITLQKWVECAGVKQANASAVCPQGVQMAIYVSVVVTDRFSPIFPLIGRQFSIRGDATVRLH